MASSDCNKAFSSNYMVLDQEEVKFLDLFHILFSSNLDDRKFVDSSATHETFRHRWLIFISIVAQKFLMFVAKPLAVLGWMIEMWLNLLRYNHGFRHLLLNLLRGKVEFPHSEGEKYLSFLGNLDIRVELDSKIKPQNDFKYYSALAVMASKISYENKAYIKRTVNDYWKMEFLESPFDYWNDYEHKAATQAFLLHDKGESHDTIVVAFRGTEPFNADDWCSDFDLSWYELPNVGKFHGGFMKALGLQKTVGWPNQPSSDTKRTAPLAYYDIRERLREKLNQNERTKFILTGHSLGGALAILFPTVLAFHEEKMLLERLEGVYTFGQPRVGDEQFGRFMDRTLEENGIKYFRFVYGNDIVPRLPYDDKDLLFKHFGTCLHYNRNYQGKVVLEEPNKNYFSTSGTIPMMINAFMELKRSFIICRHHGPEYREGWLLRTFRLIGLMIPGLPAHCPQDYVNVTRLGSHHVKSD